MSYYSLGLLLKRIDLFKMPVEMMMSRNHNNSKKKTHYYRFGTQLGGISTIVLVCVIVSYFSTLVANMYSTRQDFISKQTLNNDFNEGRDKINLNEFEFLPSIQFSNMDSTQAEVDSLGIFNSRNEIVISKVNEFVNFVVNIKIRKPNGFEDVMRKYRPCVEEDFTSNGIKFSNNDVKQKTLQFRICPDIKKTDPFWKVINGYTNEEFRQSFSLMLLKCNPKFNTKCKSDSEIQRFLKSMYFTVYLVTDDVVFNEDAEVELSAKDKFFLQFQGDIDSYKDSNNFLIIN